MLGQTEPLVILDNNINNQCILLMLGSILVVLFIVYLIRIECNKKRIISLITLKKELEEESKMKKRKK